MHCARRPESFLFAPFLICLSFGFLTGCGNRESAPPRQTGSEPKDDPVATALRRLQAASDANACREALQSIDSTLSANDPRPIVTEKDLAKIAEFARLNSEELNAVAAREFSSADPEYLTECLLLRDAVRSLELDKYPAEQKAAVAFGWVCRQVYIVEDGLEPAPWMGQAIAPIVPAPPWWVLEVGSGCALDRAMIFLALLRQIGMDGCLVGPPQLANSRSVVVSPIRGERPTYAPVRAVGVRVGKEILLFDPLRGQPIPGTDGKPIAALAQMRTNPEANSAWLKSANLKADEVKTWEVFLAGPLSSYAPRMAWLQQQLAASDALILANDLLGLRERIKNEALATGALAGVNCSFWNPADDPYSLARLLTSYSQEERGPENQLINRLKFAFRHTRFPYRFMPPPDVGGFLLKGRAFEIINIEFEREIATQFLASGSPRDMLLRGQFSNALAALDDLDRTNAGYRSRIARESNLEGAIKEWSDKASPIFAAVVSAERSGDTGALAKANADQTSFLKSPASERMVMFVRRNTSLLLCAEAKYLIALVVHERAERIQAQLERVPTNALKAEAARTWDNAVDNWNVFLNNFPELNSYYKPRFEHARELQRRAAQSLAKVK